MRFEMNEFRTWMSDEEESVGRVGKRVVLINSNRICRSCILSEGEVMFALVDVRVSSDDDGVVDNTRRDLDSGSSRGRTISLIKRVEREDN